MDIFGTVGSTIDLITKIIGYIQAVKDAGEDRRKLLSEVTALNAALLSIKNIPDVSSLLSEAGIQDPFNECYQTLQFIARKLEDEVSPTGRAGWLTKNIRWPFRQGEIKIMLDKLERFKSLILLTFQASLMKAHGKLIAVGQDSASGIVDIKNRLDTQQDQMDQVQTRLTIITDGQELKRILKSLSPLDFNGKHRATLGMHTSGTGEWFLGHPMFLGWQQGGHNVLWCPGAPGAGKSVMASAAIHRLEERITQDVAVVFIYFEYTMKYALVELFEAILKQLIQRRGITSSGMKSLQKHVGSGGLTLDELLAVLGAEMRTYSRVFIVIDALDETPAHTWVPFLKHLRALPGYISLLATSRDLGDIAEEFHEDQRLDVRAREEDVRRYIEERLSNTTTLKRLSSASGPSHEEIVTGIVEKADGMFLLAQLHMNSIEKKARGSDLRQALGELPGDLKSAYEETMGRISDEDKELAFRIFSWVLRAVGPMAMDDLRYALAVREGMTTIGIDDLYDAAYLTTICVGLITLQDPQNSRYPRPRVKVVGLVHNSTREYLLDHFSERLPSPIHLAITCLQYLSLDDIIIPRSHSFEQYSEHTERLTVFGWHLGRGEKPSTPFAGYAALHWSTHASEDYSSNDPTVRRLFIGLMRNERRITLLGSIAYQSQHVTPASFHSESFTAISAIQLCTVLGLQVYVKDLLDQCFDPNFKDSNGNTAIVEAVRLDRGEILQLLLLDQGVDVNSTTNDGSTPLLQAVQRRHQTTVKLLLEREDIDVTSRDENGRTLLSKVASDSSQAEIMELLLARKDVDVNSRDNHGRTPLSWAANSSRAETVKLLLKRGGIDVNLRDNDGRAPLSWAASNQMSSGAVGLLLAREDVNVNSRDNDGRTPLSWAASNQMFSGAVELLLVREGVDVNSRDNDGKTPLSWVVANTDQREIAKLLLERDDVDVNSCDDDGRTLLEQAVHQVNIRLVELLVARHDAAPLENINKCLHPTEKPLVFDLGNRDASSRNQDMMYIHWLLCQAADRRTSMECLGLKFLDD